MPTTPTTQPTDPMEPTRQSSGGAHSPRFRIRGTGRLLWAALRALRGETVDQVDLARHQRHCRYRTHR